MRDIPVLSGCNQLSNQQGNINDKQNHLHMLGLRTTIYKVPDLQKAKERYIKAFETNPYFDEPFYVGFNIGGYELGLDPDDIGEAKQSDNVLTYWGAREIESEYERLLSLGATEHEKPKMWVEIFRQQLSETPGQCNRTYPKSAL